jgi:hypothetical protein
VTASFDQRVRDFEGQLDAALHERPTFQVGGADALRHAANIVETAYADFPLSAPRLAKGLAILAPPLVGRRGAGADISVEALVDDLHFVAHYHQLRDLLYYTYNAPATVNWTFEEGRVEIRFADPSVPRQYYMGLNNWILGSHEGLANRDPMAARIQELLRGTPEFGQPAHSEAQVLIEEEVDLKLALYFNLVRDRFVTAGDYTFDDFYSTYRVLLGTALYHRYHAQANDVRGMVVMSLDTLSNELARSVDGISAQTVRSIVSDISFGVDAVRAGINPVYFSLYRPQDDEILMLPYHFTLWEGLINFLRLVALRDPPLFLRSFSQQIGDSLVERLAKAFRDAGFIAQTNVSLRRYGKDLPDIDLLIISEEPTLGYAVMACEVKSPLPPSWAKDELRVLEPDSIAKAFDQLSRITTFLDSDAGVQFLVSQLPRFGLPDFDEFAVIIHTLVATSENAGAFFSDRQQTIIDFRTLERLLSRCDGDMLYVLTVLRDFAEWADGSFEIGMDHAQVGDLSVEYEGIKVNAIMDFAPNEYRSADAAATMVRGMLEAGDRPLDTLRESGFAVDS